MAEDIAARWMGDSRILSPKCRGGSASGKQSKPVRVKVLGDFSHLYLMNGVGIQVPPDRIVEVGEEDAIALTARGFQRL